MAVTIAKEDACWELRLRCVMQLFLMSTLNGRPSPTVMECITLPCLKILQGLIKPAAKEKPSKDKTSMQQENKNSPIQMIDVYRWIAGDADHSFASWDKRQNVTAISSASQCDVVAKMSKDEVRALFVKEKFFKKWRQNVVNNRAVVIDVKLSPSSGSIPFHAIATSSWLKNVLFNPSSRMARQVACNMVETFCSGNFERKKQVIDLLTTFLDELKR